MGDITLGRMCRVIMRRGACRSTRRQHEFAFLQRQHIAAHDPRRVHPEVMPMAVTIRMKIPSRARRQRSAFAEQQHHHSSSGSSGSARNRSVSRISGRRAAEIARQHADQRAEEERQQHRREPHRHAICPPLPSCAPACRGPTGRCPADAPGLARNCATDVDEGRVIGPEVGADKDRTARSGKTKAPISAPLWVRNWSQTSHHWLRGGAERDRG
jgi:hypothetical protein